MATFELVLCHLGVHYLCPRGRVRAAAANRCPYWEGWRAGYAWRNYGNGWPS